MIVIAKPRVFQVLAMFVPTSAEISLNLARKLSTFDGFDCESMYPSTTNGNGANEARNKRSSCHASSGTCPRGVYFALDVRFSVRASIKCSNRSQSGDCGHTPSRSSPGLIEQLSTLIPFRTWRTPGWIPSAARWPEPFDAAPPRGDWTTLSSW